MKGNTGKFTTILFLVILSISAVSCSLFEKYIPPIKIYKSRNIDLYKIQKIALLPIVPDTEDSLGTYHSTNYLMELLVDQFPNLEYAEIEDLRENDFSFLPIIHSEIEKFNFLNLDAFNETDLGINLKSWGCDALFLGSIDSIKCKTGFDMLNILRGFKYGRKTTCYFHYYLISMKDGKVLWKSDNIGSEIFIRNEVSVRSNPSTGKAYIYPPVDAAISNGLDRMALELPSEIFK